MRVTTVNAIALVLRLGKRARREEAEEIAACDAVDVRLRVAVGAQGLEQAGVVARPLEPFQLSPRSRRRPVSGAPYRSRVRSA